MLLFINIAIIIVVLVCEDLPHVSTATPSPPSTPWLPGTQVTYRCNVGYWLSPGNFSSSIKCQLMGESKTVWSSSSHIQCIPGNVFYWFHVYIRIYNSKAVICL